MASHATLIKLSAREAQVLRASLCVAQQLADKAGGASSAASASRRTKPDSESASAPRAARVQPTPPPPPPPMEVRVVGGWVRRKLLGLDGGDMDVALPPRTNVGVFARRVLAHLGVSDRYVGVHEPGKALGKNIRAATTQLLGSSVDFVTLRTEPERKDAVSKAPQTAAKPEVEDALRRDFTVNALALNLSTLELEDMTGCGLDDLRAGVVRTCAEPVLTLTDDPGRVLRAFHLVAEHGFHLDDGLAQALRSDVVKASLDKLSRERVGRDFGKLLAYDSVVSTLREMGAAGVPDALLPLDRTKGRFAVEPPGSDSLEPFPTLRTFVREWRGGAWDAGVDIVEQMQAALAGVAGARHPWHAGHDSVLLRSAALTAPLLPQMVFAAKECDGVLPRATLLRHGEYGFSRCVTSTLMRWPLAFADQMLRMQNLAVLCQRLASRIDAPGSAEGLLEMAWLVYLAGSDLHVVLALACASWKTLAGTKAGSVPADALMARVLERLDELDVEMHAGQVVPLHIAEIRDTLRLPLGPHIDTMSREALSWQLLNPGRERAELLRWLADHNERHMRGEFVLTPSVAVEKYLSPA